MSHHFVEARDLHYSYSDGNRALNGISFVIQHGESVGIIGANGAGKSTLLLHLVGCLMPSQGDVIVGDIPVSRDTVDSVRRRIGMVFQNPDDQLFMPTVYADVAFGPLNQGLSEEKTGIRVREALETVGALHLADRPPYRLSGGEKRTVSIAAVLSMLPDILLLDEPSAGLDPRARRMVVELLKRFEHTRLIASHDLELIRDVCSRVMLLNDGRIERDGPAADILQDSVLLERCGL